MTRTTIHEVVAQIDLWISELSESELPSKCQKSTDDFMAFMTSRGVPREELEALIIGATGLMPEVLGTLKGAIALRAVIFNNEVACAEVLHSRNPSSAFVALQSARRLWGNLV